jgi:hypothetical protein
MHYVHLRILRVCLGDYGLGRRLGKFGVIDRQQDFHACHLSSPSEYGPCQGDDIRGPRAKPGKQRSRQKHWPSSWLWKQSTTYAHRSSQHLREANTSWLFFSVHVAGSLMPGCPLGRWMWRQSAVPCWSSYRPWRSAGRDCTMSSSGQHAFDRIAKMPDPCKCLHLEALLKDASQHFQPGYSG